MQGKPLRKIVENKKEVIRETALFGFYGSHVNITDGTYVYMKAPIDGKRDVLYEYTLMPTHMRSLFSLDELRDITLSNPFSFTKECRLLKIPSCPNISQDELSQIINDKENSKIKKIDNNNIIYAANFGDKLFNIKKDPNQKIELIEPKTEAYLANKLIYMMKENDCPPEQFERIGLDPETEITPEDIESMREKYFSNHKAEILNEYKWSISAVNAYRALINFIPKDKREKATEVIKKNLEEKRDGCRVDTTDILGLINSVVIAENCDMVYYFVSLMSRVK